MERTDRLLRRINQLCEKVRAVEKANKHLAHLAIVQERKIARQAESLRVAQERNRMYKAEKDRTADELVSLRQFHVLMVSDDVIRALIMTRIADKMEKPLFASFSSEPCDDEDHTESKSS